MSEEKPEEICSICHDNFVDKCSLPCGHNYCKLCIIQVLQTNHGDICPYCRSSFNYLDIKLVDSGAFLFSRTILNSVYIQGNVLGLASYHFESETDCYISYSSPQCLSWPPLDNGERPPTKKPFVNIKIDELNHIFSGDIIWYPTSWQGDVCWSYEMKFSEDRRTIESGKVIHYDSTEKSNIIKTSYFGVHLAYRRLFDIPGKPEEICSVCHDNFVDKCSLPCGHNCCKLCIIQVFQSNHGDICPYCRSSFNYLDIKLVDSGAFLFSKTILNSVYIQGNVLGLASYHFESETDCYISYSSPQCLSWPPLDNGERPPTKKPFVNIKIDELNHIFSGDIMWHPTSWEGDVCWSYEMKFSEDRRTIESGKCVSYDSTEKSNIIRTDYFGRELRYRRCFHNQN